MKALSNNTLLDISKYSNKVLKLSKYLIEAEHPILFNNLACVDETSSSIDFIEMFRKDLKKTVALSEDVFLLLSTVNNDDIVIGLKDKEKDLKKIFGNRYDNINKSINFGTFTLDLKKNFERENIESQILSSVFGENCSIDFFETLFKARKKIFEVNENKLFDDSSKINYLSVIKERDKYSFISENIKTLHNSFINHRKSLKSNDRNFIDNDITFNRAMIDSVSKQSTFISKDHSLNIISNVHDKNHYESLEEIQFLIDNSKYIDSTEIDKDCNPERLIEALEEIEKLNFKLDTQVCVKVRKLGNYGVSGLFYPSDNIIAVEVKEPASLIHEFIHAVDIKNKSIFESKERAAIVEHFSSFIDKESLVKKADYYLDPKEIIARLGEVSYILNKYNYNSNEDFGDFIERVKLEEDLKDVSELRVAHTASHYFEKHKNIYFNFKDLAKEDILLAKEYFKSYFAIDNKVKPFLENDFIKVNDTNYNRSSVVRSKYKIQPVSLFSSENIHYALDFNKKNNIIDQKKLIDAIFENFTSLNRTTKAYPNVLFSNQLKVIEGVTDWALKNNDLETAYYILNAHFKYVDIKETMNTIIAKSMLENDNKMIIDINKIFEYPECLKIIEDINSLESTDSKSLHNKDYKIRSLKYDLINAINFEYLSQEDELFPEKNNFMSNYKSCFSIEKKEKNGKVVSSKSLNSYAKNKIYAVVIEFMKNIQKDNKLIDILSFASKDDELIYHLGNTENSKKYLNKISSENISEEFNKGLLSIFIELDILDKILESHQESSCIRSLDIPEKFKEILSKSNIMKDLNNFFDDQTIDKSFLFDRFSKIINLENINQSNLEDIKSENNLSIISKRVLTEEQKKIKKLVEVLENFDKKNCLSNKRSI